MGDDSVFKVREDRSTIVLIDGPSLFSATRQLGYEIEYAEMQEHFEQCSDLHRIVYFGAVPADTEQFSNVKKLTDWLDHNGYQVILKTIEEITDDSGRRSTKGGNLSVELATEMMAAVPYVKHIVLMSNNPALAYTINVVQRLGLRVTVVGANPISNELKRCGDNFVDLEKVAKILLEEKILKIPDQTKFRRAG